MGSRTECGGAEEEVPQHRREMRGAAEWTVGWGTSVQTQEPGAWGPCRQPRHFWLISQATWPCLRVGPP